jgi:superfamily II DNA/RNA helicase
VDNVSEDDGFKKVGASCVDDDNYGARLDVLWELELGREVLGKDIGDGLGKTGFDSCRRFSAYLHSLRWNCVTATDEKRFQSPFRAGIRIEPYQLEPLRKALLLPRVNMFIADDVGLGKTIEAAMIACELLLRRRIREIVVACPPAMLPQWRDELDSRFGLAFEMLDRQLFDRIRQQYGYAVNPWQVYPRLLVSHNLLSNEAYIASLRNHLGSFRPGTLFILDEAHHAAPSQGNRYAVDSHITKAVRDLAVRFEHRLFLSATPHNGHSNSFSSLLEILDGQRFMRGIPVTPEQLKPVMVRRLKEDVRNLLPGGFPERVVEQIDISGLPADAPELVLPRLLEEYRAACLAGVEGLGKRAGNELRLAFSVLQQRLLSSAEAFWKTLTRHKRNAERALDKAEEMARADEADNPDDNDDDETRLFAEEAMTRAAEKLAAASVSAQARSLLGRLSELADASRRLPDSRILKLLEWMGANQCPAMNPGAGTDASRAWTSTRVIVFTEFDDTLRWLGDILNEKAVGTERGSERIRVYRGSTSREEREHLKAAFNAPPDEHPVRILLATDAAREGLNLQAHCRDLFHFDVPWNPARLEQRNGRIDRKLQPAGRVFCRYFVYTQRPEDRVLKALVEKTKTIARQLGSAGNVLEARLADTLALGVRAAEADSIARVITRLETDPAKSRRVQDELEATRIRRAELRQSLAGLEKQLANSAKHIRYDGPNLRDSISEALNLLGAAALEPADSPAGEPDRFVFPDLKNRFGGDLSWTGTLDTLRRRRDEDASVWDWRNLEPLRPVVFGAPSGIDDSVVQLHLQHRLVRRLLGRFTSQGFVYHDLSRACFAQSRDNLVRVLLLGRLCLYGDGATRLHEELLAAAAEWRGSDKEPRVFRDGGQGERKAMDILEDALKDDRDAAAAGDREKRYLDALGRDAATLLPHLEAKGKEAREEAEKALARRGEAEAGEMRAILDRQLNQLKKQIASKDQERQLSLFPEEELEQLERDRRHWEKRVAELPREMKDEPERIRAQYRVRAARLEPVGIVYLHPGGKA